MRPSCPSPRLLALLIALLPGLLPCGGEHLRVCLHALLGVEDGCGAPAERDTLPSCCAPAPDGPTLTSEQTCDGCCVDLAAQAQERATPAPTTSASSETALAMPPRAGLAPVAPLPRLALASRPCSGRAAPPAPPITPLRI